MYNFVRLYYIVRPSQDTISYLEHTISCINIKTCCIRYCTSTFDSRYRRYGTCYVICTCSIRYRMYCIMTYKYHIFTYDIVYQNTISYTTYDIVSGNMISYVNTRYHTFITLLYRFKRNEKNPTASLGTCCGWTWQKIPKSARKKQICRLCTSNILSMPTKYSSPDSNSGSFTSKWPDTYHVLEVKTKVYISTDDLLRVPVEYPIWLYPYNPVSVIHSP
jgi:hypothetical protein